MPERGQASIDYLAVVALVACVVALGAGAARATGIGKAFTAQLARALCVVAGGACEADRLPCPTSWRRAEKGGHVVISVVRLGAGRLQVEEQRSDGSIAITRGRSDSAGLEVAHGAKAKAGSHEVGVWGRATALAVAGGGRTWVVPDRAAADRLTAALERGEDVPPTESFDDGTSLRLSAGAAARGPQAGVGADVERTRLVGRRIDHTTGRVTTYRRSDVRGGGSVNLGNGKASVTYDGAFRLGRDDVALTRERDGRPVELVLTRSIPRGALPPEAAEAAGLLPSSVERQVVVLERRLDLADPAARRAAVAFSDGDDRAAPAVERLLAERAVVHVRAYRLETSKQGGGVDVGGLIARAGGGLESATERARLVGAITRDLAGRWRRRDDCLA